jgi:Bacterial transcriptional activator domain/AAA ATPase domain
VFDSGSALKLSKQTQRVIVGLASSRGLAVHADTLVDRLWDEPPADYQVATRVAIKRARQQLNDAPLLETVQLGYRYECDPATVDLWRFEFEAERLLRVADPNSGPLRVPPGRPFPTGKPNRGLLSDPAAAKLQEIEACLAIWQGDPFGAFGALPYLLPLTTHYTELHRSLQELWLNQLVHGDDRARAVRVGEMLVAAEPLRENRWASLMTALYRNDRQTDALRAYQRARETLADAAGLEPGSALIDLERRILDHDPALLTGMLGGLAAEIGGQGDQLRTLIGRDEELRLLTAPAPLSTTRESVATRGFCVVGEPGIGKTSLLRSTAAVLKAQGRLTVSIDAPERPTRPTETLSSLIIELLAIPQVTAPTLREVIALASVVPQHDFDEVDLGTEELDRAEVVSRITAYIASTVEHHDIAVFVDDCQWLDRVSAEVLRGLTERTATPLYFAANPSSQPHLQWLFAGAGDPVGDHVNRNPELKNKLTNNLNNADPGAEARRRAAVTSVELRALKVHEVRLFLESRRVSSAVAQRVEEFWERSGGNPLLLDLLLDAAATNNFGDLSASTRAVVLHRLEALSQRAITTLEYASVLGKTFSLDNLMLARPGALGDLLEASDARLVSVLRSESGDRHFSRDEQLHANATCTFQHGLVAEIVYDQIPEGRRVELHDQIGEILASKNAPAVGYARHFVAAAALDPLRAANSCLLAAVEHEVAYGFEPALVDCESGLLILRQYSRTAVALQAKLTVKNGRLLRLCQLPNSRSRLLEGAELAQVAELNELFAEAVIELCSHGETTKAGGVDSDVVVLLDDALNLAIPMELSARLCGAAATHLATSSAGVRGRDLFLRAMTLAEGAGQPHVEADVLMNTHLGLSDPADLALRAHAAQRLRSLANRNGYENPDMLHLWEATYLDFNVAIVRADRSALDQSIVELRRITPFVKERPRTFGLAMIEGAYAHAIGDLDSSAEHAEVLLQLGLASFDSSWAIAVYSALKLSIEIDRGAVGLLGSTVDRLITDQPELRTWHSLAALIALETGDAKRAAHELNQVVQAGRSLLTRDHTWGPTVMCASRVAHGLHDENAARILFELVSPHTEQMSWSGAATFGPFDLALSLLSFTLGNEEAAVQHQALSNSLAKRLGCISYER